MKKRTWFFSIFLILLVSFGCSSSDDKSVSSDSGTGSTETSFNFTLTSFKKQETASSALGRQANFTAAQVMTGQLTATNTGTSAIQTFDWSIYFDETTFAVQSNKTIILAPGTYDFALLLTKGDQQYAGSVPGQTISDGQFNVPMTIRPIIGNTVTDVSLLASLADFKFQYDVAELATAGFVAPQLGVILDGGTEVIFGINPATGISDSYINLTAGSHGIKLKLYDGSIQRGRSIAAQETVIVSPGLNIAMDLVALHGETTFVLTEAGGDGNFSFNIPAEVVDEAGGLANLEVVFTLNGVKNGNEVNTLSLTSDGPNNYQASITLTNKQFENVTIGLAFNDTSKSPKEELGTCAMATTLDTTERTVNCSLTLRRRAIIGGSLLATLGINVFNEAGEPVPGAAVYKDGALIGVTNSGTFGTEGYLKTFVTTGSYTIRAENGGKCGSQTVSADALGISNIDIELVSCIPTNGLIAYYPFNGNANDESGVGTDGTFHNTPTPTTDRVDDPDKAYLFDGTGHTDEEYINLGTDYFGGRNKLTISIWFNTSVIKNEACLLTNMQDVNEQFILGPTSQVSNKILFKVNTGGGAYSNIQIISDNAISINTWYHVVVTYDAATVKMYVDGVLQAQTASTTGNLMYKVGVLVGAERRNAGWPSSPSGYTPFNGKVDDIRFYDRALTPSEVQDLYGELNP